MNNNLQSTCSHSIHPALLPLGMPFRAQSHPIHRTMQPEAAPLAQLEIADSRFLAFVKPVATKEAAEAFQRLLKAQHSNAAHCPVAFFANLSNTGNTQDVLTWSDDDGEPPAAAAGSVLSSEIQSTSIGTSGGLAVVIVRYFGHRLLGVTCGRLSQCYESVTELALHRYWHGKEQPRHKQVADVDGNVYGLGAGDTEVILDVISDPNNALIDQIVSEVEFEGFLGSKQEELPRKQNLQADGVAEGIIPVYRYPGNYRGDEWATFPWSPTTHLVKEAVEKALLPLVDQKMNHCVANFYRDGTDFIDHHSDKDLDLDQDGVIVSVSLGEERILELRRRAEPRDTTRIVLPHGSMLVLGPKTNASFTHSILRKTDSTGPRLSLTMRNVKTFLDIKTGRLYGQGVAVKTLEEIRSSVLKENALLLAGSAAGALFALSPRLRLGANGGRSMKMKATEALLFGSTYAATLFSLRFIATALVKRREEKDARSFFSSQSVSGTKY